MYAQFRRHKTQGKGQAVTLRRRGKKTLKWVLKSKEHVNLFDLLGLVRNGVEWRGFVHTAMNFGFHTSVNCCEHQFIRAKGSVY
jgi:hypothetical protein